MQVHFGASAARPSACALTIGNFDGVHRGHQAMLACLRERASARGLPTALLTFEPHPREVLARGNPPARPAPVPEKVLPLTPTRTLHNP